MQGRDSVLWKGRGPHDPPSSYGQVRACRVVSHGRPDARAPHTASGQRMVTDCLGGKRQFPLPLCLGVPEDIGKLYQCPRFTFAK